VVDHVGTDDMTAAAQWTRDLASWALPPHILDAAPTSPWGYSADVFIRRADTVPPPPTPSTERAREALPEDGSGVILDVGCGAGTASLPLASVAGRLIGVDPSAQLLAAFRERAEALGTVTTMIEGVWPDVAGPTPVADVVVCHHVAYNVPELAPFLRRLTDHARRRVVLELTARHPMSALNDLWLQFHGVTRPSRPTADDVVAVLRELGLSPRRAEWMAPAFGWGRPFARREDLVASLRRRLCLPMERDGALADALAAQVVERDGVVSLPPRPVVALWWDGAA